MKDTDQMSLRAMSACAADKRMHVGRRRTFVVAFGERCGIDGRTFAEILCGRRGVVSGLGFLSFLSKGAERRNLFSALCAKSPCLAAFLVKNTTRKTGGVHLFREQAILALEASPLLDGLPATPEWLVFLEGLPKNIVNALMHREGAGVPQDLALILGMARRMGPRQKISMGALVAGVLGFLGLADAKRMFLRPEHENAGPCRKKRSESPERIVGSSEFCRATGVLIALGLHDAPHMGAIPILGLIGMACGYCGKASESDLETLIAFAQTRTYRKGRPWAHVPHGPTRNYCDCLRALTGDLAADTWRAWPMLACALGKQCIRGDLLGAAQLVRGAKQRILATATRLPPWTKTVAAPRTTWQAEFMGHTDTIQENDVRFMGGLDGKDRLNALRLSMELGAFADTQLRRWCISNVRTLLEALPSKSAREDFYDWARADAGDMHAVLGLRAWNRRMSARTAVRLSGQWHERLASVCGCESDAVFSWDPLRNAPSLFGVSWTFLATPSELFREGGAMRHCVGTLAQDAMSGTSAFYSIISKHPKFRGTLEVERTASGGRLGQLRGARNSVAPRSIETRLSSMVEKHAKSPSFTDPDARHSNGP